MREFMRIVEGVEEIGGIRVSLNPSPSQLPSLCHNLSKHRALRGWFFITKTDPRIQCVVWAAEKQSHFAMGNAMRRAGFDAVQSSPLIISLDVNDTLQACDWGSWNVYQSGDLFYVRDGFGQTADFDETFNHFFPSSEELEVEYNDDSEWEIVEGIVENASRDSHYMPLEPLFKDRQGGSMRKYRITKTGETLLVAVMRDGKDDDGDDIYSVTPYISQDGSLKDIGNGKVVVSNGTAYFSNIGVVPEYRRLGIATAMYDQIEDMGFDLNMSPGDVFPDALNMWSYRSGRSSPLSEDFSDRIDDFDQPNEIGQILATIFRANPLDRIFYHGAAHAFDAFEPVPEDWRGIHFTSDIEHARHYAKVRAQKLGGRPIVYEVRLKVSRPLYTDETNDYRREIKYAKKKRYDCVVGPTHIGPDAAINITMFDPGRITIMNGPKITAVNEDWDKNISVYGFGVPAKPAQVDIFRNPSRKEFTKLLRDSQFKTLRALISDGDLLVWDAALTTHNDVQKHYPQARSIYLLLYADHVEWNDINFENNEEDDYETYPYDGSLKRGIDLCHKTKALTHLYGQNFVIIGNDGDTEERVSMTPEWVAANCSPSSLNESQEEIIGTVYLKSPSLGVLKAYVQRDWAKNLRGLLAPNLKDVYVWKGEQKLHDEAMKDLGLDYRSVGLSYWDFRFDIQFNDTDNAYYFRVGADNHYAFADNRYIRSITDIDEETPGVTIRLK